MSQSPDSRGATAIADTMAGSNPVINCQNSCMGGNVNINAAATMLNDSLVASPNATGGGVKSTEIKNMHSYTEVITMPHFHDQSPSSQMDLLTIQKDTQQAGVDGGGGSYLFEQHNELKDVWDLYGDPKLETVYVDPGGVKKPGVTDIKIDVIPPGGAPCFSNTMSPDQAQGMVSSVYADAGSAGQNKMGMTVVTNYHDGTSSEQDLVIPLEGLDAGAKAGYGDQTYASLDGTSPSINLAKEIGLGG